VGVVLARLRPAWIPASVHDAKDQSTDSVVDHLLAHGRLPHTLPNTRRALTLALVCGALWLAPVVVTRLTGPPILADLGVYFSEMAVVTFGGAYAVLAGMADHAVTSGWLSTAQMLQGLGFAETTPGPLILVVEYVGMFAAWHASSSWWIALCGAALSVWVTFAPCFLWVFVGGPYVEALRHVRALYAALAGITAAVVGVIASLSVWFALHTVFVRVHEWTWGVLRVPVPELASIDLRVVALTSLSLLLLLRFNQSTPRTLAIVTVLGALLQWLT
jgi:chromate transporter